MSVPTADIFSFGERGWIANICGFENAIASGVAANAIADALRGQDGIDDAVAGVSSVVIRYDPQQIDPDVVREHLEEEIAAAPQTVPPAGDPIIIPVCYGGEFGPDLAALCARAGISEEAFINTHTSASYRVATLGFAPGFAYIGELEEKLRAPRLETPRPRVSAGSVGVAGAFTGIYPLPSPGGWNLIGRTPLTLFDPSREHPFLLAPGAAIRFEAIDAAAFTAEDPG